MRYMKWIGLAAAIMLVVSCFIPWVFVEGKSITISGVDSGGSAYGKPGYFHFVLAAFFLAFNFIPRVWAKRTNFLIVALNIAWAIRNYFIISACYAGDCPEKKAGIFLMLLASLLMLVAALFPDIKLKEKKIDG